MTRAKQAAKREKEYANVRAAQQTRDQSEAADQDSRQHEAQRGDLGISSSSSGEELGPMDRDLTQGKVKSEEDDMEKVERDGRKKWGTVTEDDDQEGYSE